LSFSESFSGISPQPKLAEDLFVRNTFAALNGCMCRVEGGGFPGRDRFIFDWCVGQRPGDGIDHNLQQLGDGLELARIELIDHMVYTLSVGRHSALSSLLAWDR